MYDVRLASPRDEAADLHPSYDGNSGRLACGGKPVLVSGPSVRPARAAQDVVIGYRDGVKPPLPCSLDELSHRSASVREARVGVKVCAQPAVHVCPLPGLGPNLLSMRLA